MHIAQPAGTSNGLGFSRLTLGFRLLNIDFRHVAKAETLPFHHRDPFDRLIIAQALLEKLTIVSCDTALSEYGIKRIWQ